MIAEKQTKSVRITTDQRNKLQILIDQQLYIAQAARQLGLTRQTIHRVLKTGRCSPATAKRIDSI